MVAELPVMNDLQDGQTGRWGKSRPILDVIAQGNCLPEQDLKRYSTQGEKTNRNSSQPLSHLARIFPFFLHPSLTSSSPGRQHSGATKTKRQCPGNNRGSPDSHGKHIGSRAIAYPHRQHVSGFAFAPYPKLSGPEGARGRVLSVSAGS